MPVASESRSRGDGNGIRPDARLQPATTPLERVRTLNGAVIRRLFRCRVRRRLGRPFFEPGSAWPLPIRRCENDIGVLVQGNAAWACGLRAPQVAGRLGVVPRPPDRRCRSGSPGRGRERPGPLGCLLRHRVGSACASPCRPPRRVAPAPSVLCRKAVAHRGRQRPEAERCLPRPTPPGTASPRRGRWEVAPGVALRVIMMNRQDVATLRARSRG